MKVIVFGATGMVGLGTLREALASPDVEAVLSVSRSACGVRDPKLTELLLPDLFEFAAVEEKLVGYDACLWAVGVSSVGLDEPKYARITEELTLKWATALLRLNPGISFTYCSGAGAGGSAMWARVRQRVEGALKAMPFKHVGVVRPAFIRPGKGIRSRTLGYQAGILVMTPFFWLSSLWLKVMPGLFTTSEILGRAMLRTAQGKADKYILESADLNRVGR